MSLQDLTVPARALLPDIYLIEDKIKSRYIKALDLLPQIINTCDKILVYDNSVKPVLIYIKDEKGSNYFPNEFWPADKLKKLLNLN